MIKTAVVGLGFMGQTHITCYQNNPLALVIAASDRNPSRVVWGGTRAGHKEAHTARAFFGGQKRGELGARF